MFSWMMLVACTGGDGLLGDEIGVPLNDGDTLTLEVRDTLEEVRDSESAPGADSDENGLFAGECQGMDSTVPDPPLVAVGGENLIQVTHYGVPSGATPNWEVTGEVDGNQLLMDYGGEDTDTPECLWEMQYTIYGLPAGEWTVVADGHEATATVTGETW